MATDNFQTRQNLQKRGLQMKSLLTVITLVLGLMSMHGLLSPIYQMRRPKTQISPQDAKRSRRRTLTPP